MTAQLLWEALRFPLNAGLSSDRLGNLRTDIDLRREPVLPPERDVSLPSRDAGACKPRLNIRNQDEAAQSNVQPLHHGEIESTYTIGKSFSNLSSGTAARPPAASGQSGGGRASERDPVRLGATAGFTEGGLLGG